MILTLPYPKYTPPEPGTLCVVFDEHGECGFQIWLDESSKWSGGGHVIAPRIKHWALAASLPQEVQEAAMEFKRQRNGAYRSFLRDTAVYERCITT